ncbi:MAG: hypothetical protein CME30_00400, partial [Gemmatimonadetes bacterium]|nr:hypothetical protein [Gemmatimonadota bacterium]
MKLVVVESPAKARTISRYLGSDYKVVASVGHIRDLPDKELGVDIENDFKPKYVTTNRKILSELKKQAESAQAVILATDPDREGEAIAYHIAERLGMRDAEEEKDQFQRVTFREITRDAILKALDQPGAVNMERVEAQKVRRVLDRLVGFQASSLLTKPIMPGLSAGRVQTVALRLICELEEKIRAFVEEEYWSLKAELIYSDQVFQASLVRIAGEALRNQKSWKVSVDDKAAAQELVGDISGVPFQASDIIREEKSVKPKPPFTTSTLQQRASTRLRLSAKQTMGAAQGLYQNGLITYIRTDSTRVSAGAVNQARGWIEEQFGEAYIPAKGQFYGGKNEKKSTQDAHEAIRPTKVSLHPSEASKKLDANQAEVYELVWLRFVASQMSAKVYDNTRVVFMLAGNSSKEYEFQASGSVVKFPGHERLYVEAKESGKKITRAELPPIPNMGEGDVADLKNLNTEKHFTRAPGRFSEAGLVKKMEDEGIGRPSTYAAIVSKIVEREYVELKNRRFHPTELGEGVCKFLTNVFKKEFEVEFTKQIEIRLDDIERGDLIGTDLLSETYDGFKKQLEYAEAQPDLLMKEIFEAQGEKCEECSHPMLIKWNRGGSFLGCSDYPNCKHNRPLAEKQDRELGSNPDGRNVRLRFGRFGPYVEMDALSEGQKPSRASLEESQDPVEIDLSSALELLESQGDRVLGPGPGEMETVFLKKGPYGPYVELDKNQEGEKPKRVSIPKDKPVHEVDLSYGLLLLELPRTLGSDPDSGEEIHAGIGRYGPFVRRADVYANLKDSEDIW